MAPQLAADHQRRGEDAFALRVEDGAQREENVGGGERGAVGPGGARAQVERVGAAVGARLPAFGEPRLDLEGGTVDAEEAPLRQEGDDVEGGIAGDEAVEGRDR